MLPKPKGCCPNSFQMHKRDIYKCISKGEGRIPLKYVMTIFLSNLEYILKKYLASWKEFGFPFFMCPNSCQEVKLLASKVLPCKHFGGLSPLDTSVKAERSTFRSLPIKLLNFLHLSTNGHSMKNPLNVYEDKGKFNLLKLAYKQSL